MRSLYALKEKGIKVGNVFIVGNINQLNATDESVSEGEKQRMLDSLRNEKEPRKSKALSLALGKSTKYLAALGLIDSEIKSTPSMLERFNIQYSPAWVVHHQGFDYVFEGFENPDELFDARGDFIRGQ